MTSYKSLSGELADLMRQAALDDTDMRPAARVRRATAGETSIRSALGEMKNVQYGSVYHQGNVINGIPVPPSFQRPSYQMDAHGFPLPLGTSHEVYQAIMSKNSEHLSKQKEKWSELHRGNGLFTHGPGRSRPKRAIRLGIPSHIRLNAWTFYSTASQIRVGYQTEYYGELAVSKVPSRMFDLEIGQTFVTNLRFGTLLVASGTEPGQKIQARNALSRVLLAYSHHFKLQSVPGSLNVIASALLLATEDEEQTFWLLVAHSRKAGPSYSSLRGRNCVAEQDVLMVLLEEKYPKLVKHFRSSGIDSLQQLTAPWTSSLFIEHLPFDTVLRVLDAYFHEGPKILLRVSLALFHINMSTLLQIREPFELRQAIKDMPLRMLDQDLLMDTAFNGIGSMSTAKIDRLRKKALEKWDTSRRPSNYDDGSLLIALEEDDEMFAFGLGITAPMPFSAVPMTKVNVSTESSDALLSVSPPRFRKQHINSALLSSLAEEEDTSD